MSQDINTRAIIDYGRLLSECAFAFDESLTKAIDKVDTAYDNITVPLSDKAERRFISLKQSIRHILTGQFSFDEVWESGDYDTIQAIANTVSSNPSIVNEYVYGSDYVLPSSAETDRLVADVYNVSDVAKSVNAVLNDSDHAELKKSLTELFHVTQECAQLLEQTLKDSPAGRAFIDAVTI